MASGNTTSRIGQGNSNHGYHSNYNDYLYNKRRTVFRVLDEDPQLAGKKLAKILDIPSSEYENEKRYLKKLKHDWLSNYPKQRGSIRSYPDDVHNAFFRGELPVGVVGVVREELFEVWGRAGVDRWLFPSYPGARDGWKFVRKAPNRYLLFKSGQGRIRFFQNGTVEIFVRKPASMGKCMQVFCDAFYKTGLLSEDSKVDDSFKKTLATRMHATFDVGRKLPYMKIVAFQDTHNFSFVSGDRTHPTSFEFMFDYNGEVESARDIVRKVGEVLGMAKSEESATTKPLSKDGEYSR